MALLQCGIITTCSHMNITHAVHSDGGWCQHPWKTAKVKGAKSHWASVQQRMHVGVKGQTTHSCIRISSEIHSSMFFIFPQATPFSIQRSSLPQILYCKVIYSPLCHSKPICHFFLTHNTKDVLKNFQVPIIYRPQWPIFKKNI